MSQKSVVIAWHGKSPFAGDRNVRRRILLQLGTGGEWAGWALGPISGNPNKPQLPVLRLYGETKESLTAAGPRRELCRDGGEHTPVRIITRSD